VAVEIRQPGGPGHPPYFRIYLLIGGDGFVPPTPPWQPFLRYPGGKHTWVAARPSA